MGKSTGSKHINNSKAFIKYSNNMESIYKTIEEFNPKNKHEKFIGFDETIADMPNNNKFDSRKIGLFNRGRKLNISFVFHHTIIF